MFPSLLKIKVMCETRWVERHTNMHDFFTMFTPILDTLDSIVNSEGWDSKSKTEAQGLLTVLSTSTFIVAFSSHYHMMGHTKQLSVLLQGRVYCYVPNCVNFQAAYRNPLIIFFFR